MKRNTIATLAIILIVGIGVFIMLERQQHSPHDQVVDWGINRITSDTVDTIRMSEGKNSLVLSRQSSGWNVNAVKADDQFMRQLWDQWKTVAVHGPVSTNKSNHGAYGVDDASGRSVTFFNRGKELLHIIIGGMTPAYNGNYVRRAPEDSVYTVTPPLNTIFSVTIDDWKEKSKSQVEKNKSSSRK